MSLGAFALLAPEAARLVAARSSRLLRLRAAPSPDARNILALIECVHSVRARGLDRACEAGVPPAVFERLAEEGLRMTTQHLGQLSPDRRYAVLAVTVTRLESRLIEATLNMFDELIGSAAALLVKFRVV